MPEFVSKEDFIAYLRTLPPDHQFTREPDKLWAQCCPLACCLKARGAPNPGIGLSTWYDDPRREMTTVNVLPTWAQKFVRRFDDRWESPGDARGALEDMDGL